MMDRKKRNTIAIVSLSVLSAAGIFYYIYYKTKIKKLNEQIKTASELQQQIDNLDVPEGEIEPEPVDPNSESNMEFDENGNPIDPVPVSSLMNNNLDTYGGGDYYSASSSASYYGGYMV